MAGHAVQLRYFLKTVQLYRTIENINKVIIISFSFLIFIFQIYRERLIVHLVKHRAHCFSCVGKSCCAEQVDGLLYLCTHLVGANLRAGTPFSQDAVQCHSN